MSRNITPSFQSPNREETKTEILSLLNILYHKVDLERTFGVSDLQVSPSGVHHPALEKNTVTKQIKQKIISNETRIPEEPEYDQADNVSTLKSLEEQAKQCTDCELSKSRTNVVFGTGSPNSDLMFVGEAPGYYEDIKGEPFVGKAGQLLTKIIEAIDLKRGEVYIANVLKCRPPGNRNPSPNEIISCTPYLFQQIDLINPKIICALGTFAAQALLKSTATIGTLRGKFHEFRSTKLIATYHPAYLLRNPSEKRKTWEDMKKIRDFLNS
ncbi:MAG: uracil-DNA glycosylase [Candidatus Scalindua sp.]|nr:uracil-DNA glycosylase [Candidatus Scalindua sp.]